MHSEIGNSATIHSFTAIDFETANAKLSSICQIGLVRVEHGVIVQELDILVQPPNNEYHWGNSRVHGLYRKDTAHAPYFNEVWHLMEPYIKGQHVVAHNAPFDCNCLQQTLALYQLNQPRYHKHCTVKLFKRNLSLLCNLFQIPLQHHNALSDARACAHLFMMHLQGHTQVMQQMVSAQFPSKSSNTGR
jgi:DNA polymerase-3 subunit epsilon